MAMKSQVVFWVVAMCSDVIGNKRFRAARSSSKTSVSYNITIWHHNPEDQDFIGVLI